MLSRIADNLFWAGRYIERAEASARLINATGLLLLDLPDERDFHWHTLIEIMGAEAGFDARYDAADETRVMDYLAMDRDHPGSIAASLIAARENLRSARDHVPRELWEEINALHLFMAESADVRRRVQRSQVMDRIIRSARIADGHINAGMSRDAAYDMLTLGIAIERADMTTRVLDVRTADLLPQTSEALPPYRNAQWISVLKSLSAFQMYRRHVRSRVTGPSVVSFLLTDPAFPRSAWFCLKSAGDKLARLPSPGPAKIQLARVERTVNGVDASRLSGERLTHLLDRIQSEIAALTEAIAARYFDGAHA
ncbi:alpha-E domain-containing protein [Salinisphaera sp. SPP-AMP-43]|uniref:alpha-E domain-containing protein n=1 Tax=Salinisphaera sp. SPP-AMP-43 TaxID=3121288 RepID=UPI003C6E0694